MPLPPCWRYRDLWGRSVADRESAPAHLYLLWPRSETFWTISPNPHRSIRHWRLLRVWVRSPVSAPCRGVWAKKPQIAFCQIEAALRHETKLRNNLPHKFECVSSVFQERRLRLRASGLLVSRIPCRPGTNSSRSSWGCSVTQASEEYNETPVCRRPLNDRSWWILQ